jgi:hypothetical protein
VNPRSSGLSFVSGSHYQYGNDDRGSEFLCVVSREYPAATVDNSNGHEGPIRTDKAKVSRSATRLGGTFVIRPKIMW